MGTIRTLGNDRHQIQMCRIAFSPRLLARQFELSALLSMSTLGSFTSLPEQASDGFPALSWHVAQTGSPDTLPAASLGAPSKATGAAGALGIDRSLPSLFNSFAPSHGGWRYIRVFYRPCSRMEFLCPGSSGDRARSVGRVIASTQGAIRQLLLRVLMYVCLESTIDERSRRRPYLLVFMSDILSSLVRRIVPKSGAVVFKIGKQRAWQKAGCTMAGETETFSRRLLILFME